MVCPPMGLSDDDAKARLTLARPSGQDRREALIVAAVLFAFGFLGMYVFLHEPLQKSLVVGLMGSAVGSFRFALRKIARPR